MSGMHFRDASAPDGRRLYAIGDVHGRLDLLTAMHRTIAAEIANNRPADWRIVHLGDYVDRGPDAKGVIDFLIETQQRDKRNLMLAGNHEIGFLDFLNYPDPVGLFMLNGGVETARSYGVALTQENRSLFGRARRTLETGHTELVRAVPQSHVDFLQSLGASATFGDFFFCHAGIRPGIALEKQDRRDLLWIRDIFLDHPGLYAKVIVHGHTPSRQAEIRANRVNVDTRAYASGLLTALVVDGEAKTILTVMEDGSVQRSEAVTP